MITRNIYDAGRPGSPVAGIYPIWHIYDERQLVCYSLLYLLNKQDKYVYSPVCMFFRRRL